VSGNIVNTSDIEYHKDKKCTFIKNFKSYCAIEGEWTNSLKFDGVDYWNIGEDKLIPFLQQDYLLPSDSCHRKDIHSLMQNDTDSSQKIKEEYEQIQRNDKDLREKFGPKKENKKKK